MDVIRGVGGGGEGDGGWGKCVMYSIAGEYDRKRKSTSLLQIFFF